jgi:hypothetical protein
MNYYFEDMKIKEDILGIDHVNTADSYNVG